ncbi:M23 family metallopeptidase [Nocardioides sp. URHA0020]|uniref:M23 family metallopeptidase n=1 Tax=Nocardioides sp. URHA0020 TaxID=1380392 RepID=UPI00048CFF03|nr:M23 family metallopeptidase [Nocardioides sp. URHA0020]
MSLPAWSDVDRSMALPLPKKNLNRTAGWLYRSGNIHAGFDYGVDIGTPVFAVRGGRILRTVDNIPNMAPGKAGKSGDPPNFILQAVRYRNKPATVVYLHVSPHFSVKEGDEVRAGEQIALSGHNGHSTGPHLHISVLEGHDHLAPFDYLRSLANDTKAPNGLASNGITIYPPSLVYGRAQPSRLATGSVVMADLVFGTMDSDSVRRLQHRLNGIHLEGGAELPVTGNYLDRTRAEVIKWQLQKRHLQPGSANADGNVHPKQAKALFGSRFTLV